MRSLRAGEGEVRPGEVVSMRSGCGILADAGMGPLIKPTGIRLVGEMIPGRILIGCWAGRLVRLWKLGMLYWGTHPSPGWRASSRRASSGSWKLLMMMLSLAPSWPYLAGYLARFRWRRMILFAVISGWGGCWVGDPVKAAFQGR